MIILQANKIERSFAGGGSFDNISLQVDERDRIAWSEKNGRMEPASLRSWKSWWEKKSRLGKSIKSGTFLYLYLAQDSRFESSNTIYDEMLHVFDDLRKTEKTLRQMELAMGEKLGLT